MTTYLTKLFDHLAWADARVLDGLRTASGTDPRALELYAHIVGAEHVWLTRLQQCAARVPVWPTLSLDECAARAAENVAGFRAVLASSTPASIAHEVPYTNSAGQAFHSTVEDILLHVTLHGAYHRGQVAFVVRGAGGEPVPSDYIAFARGAPAATRETSL